MKGHIHLSNCVVFASQVVGIRIEEGDANRTPQIPPCRVIMTTGGELHFHKPSDILEIDAWLAAGLGTAAKVDSGRSET